MKRWFGVILGVTMMVGSLGATRFLLTPLRPDGTRELIPLKKGMTVEEAIQLAQQKPALPPSINQINDTLNYSPDPRYILSGIDVGDTLVTWFQSSWDSSYLVSVLFHVYVADSPTAFMYAFASAPDPNVSFSPVTDSGVGPWYDYHFGNQTSGGPSPIDYNNIYASNFFNWTTNPGTDTMIELTLPSPVFVGTNVFLAGYTPLANGAPSEPWVLITAGTFGTNYGYHNLEYQQGVLGGQPAGWYATWHAHDFYAVIEVRQNIPPNIKAVVDLSDTYDRDGPFDILALITDVGYPAGNDGVASAFCYYQVNGGAVDSLPMTVLQGDSTNGIFGCTLDFAASPLNPGDVVTYWVAATDVQGLTSTSNQYSFTVRAKNGNILYVTEDGMDAGNLMAYYALQQAAAAVSGGTFSVDLWDITTMGAPDASVIEGNSGWAGPYQAIFFTGFDAHTLAADSALYMNYLNNGGNLLVSAQDIFVGGFGYVPAYDSLTQAQPGWFVYDYLGIGEFMDDYVGTLLPQGPTAFVGVDPNSPVGGSFAAASDTLTNWPYFGSEWNPYAAANPAATQELAYAADGSGAAISYVGTNFKTVFTGALIPYFVTNLQFDTSGAVVAYDPDTLRTQQLLQNVLTFFGVGVEEAAHPVQVRGLRVRQDAGKLQLSVRVPSATDLRVELLDVTGRQVRLLHKGRVSSGEHTWAVPVNTLGHSGVYFLRVKAGDQNLVRRVTIVR